MAGLGHRRIVSVRHTSHRAPVFDRVGRLFCQSVERGHLWNLVDNRRMDRLNGHAHDEIADLIVALHELFRSDDPSDFNNKVNLLRQSIDTLAQSEAFRSSSRDGRNSLCPGIVSTFDSPPLYSRLVQQIDESSTVRIATAFLSAGETNPLIRPLESLVARSGEVRILTSLMGFFNRPETFSEFLSWREGLSLRLYVENLDDVETLLSGIPPAFHAKTFLFSKDGRPNVMAIGSANMTGAAMAGNIEWNYISDFEVNANLNSGTSPYMDAVARFDTLWEKNGYIPDDAFIEQYAELHRRAAELHKRVRGLRHVPEQHVDEFDRTLAETDQAPCPRPAQQAALASLSDLRDAGARKFAVIAATGLGKTLLSAFEVRNAGARRVLFLAHREIILRQAMDNYKKVFPDTRMILVRGAASLEEVHGDKVHVFAMFNTLAERNNYKRISADFFDYVIIDEFHHSAAPSYRKVVDHFAPKYLLGMTATPERADGQDILELCNREIAYEVRLFDAIERRWLAPFQYFALYDPTDYEQVRWTGIGYDEQELEIALSNDTRADLVTRALRRYQPPYGKHKVLAFCSNVGHAKWTAAAFGRRGFPAEVVLGETDETTRRRVLERLENENDDLKVLCAVDVLNEGIDVPLITHILLMRPTQSFTVFLQQIGRGLRLHPEKPFVTVLDFVGNFQKSYVAPLALQGYHNVPAQDRLTLPTTEFRVPKWCLVDADTDVHRIWNDDIERLDPRGAALRRLETVIEDLAIGKKKEEVRLPEFFLLDGVDSYTTQIRRNGGWLAVRIKLGLADDAELELEGTVGEKFLKHVEQELRPNKSYKMTVLRVLLDLSGQSSDVPFEWNVKDIASGFLDYYLENTRRRDDWSDLAKHKNPAEYPIRSVVTHLRRMPLAHLSRSTERDLDKFFELDSDTFSIVETVRDYWRDPFFRRLVFERVEFAEALYWYTRNKSPAKT
ncbi:MAG: hypothetical protein EA426_00510 [Spirochaetaceae bacterium]|nr:MAG: hypothetical protein EA426_00510 [Spirochaetaceae bacterium]